MTTQPTDCLQEMVGRTPKGTFAKGHIHNPHGRTKGSRNKATEAALTLMGYQLEKITQTAINAATGGDMTAIKLILDKLLPTARERCLPDVDLPQISNASDLPRLTNAVLEALASGQITPSEGERITGIAAQYGKILELSELADRVAALEKRQGIDKL